jgi:hypothetical protein
MVRDLLGELTKQNNPVGLFCFVRFRRGESRLLGFRSDSKGANDIFSAEKIVRPWSDKTS